MDCSRSVFSRRRAVIAATLACALCLVLAGCSDSRSVSVRRHASTVPKEPGPDFALLASHRPPPRPFPISSPARTGAGDIARRYTCHGSDLSPPVSWRDLPPQTKEMVVFVDTLGHGLPTLFWAVAGLRPSASLSAGRLPRGAIVGRNSRGSLSYSVCPAEHPAVISIVVVALPRRLGLRPGFSSAAVLAKTTTPDSHRGSLVMFSR
jgi:phosphatidylethanolamine-binding protein (PEBP) family uncharacterized protein